MDARLEQIFREETRQSLGVERMTAERLIREIAAFPVTAPPEEVALFAQFVRGLASGMAPADVPAATEALAAVFRPEAPVSPVAPSTGAQRPVATPFHVPYPAQARPRAVAPVPIPAPELDPSPDDIEDFTANGS